MRQIAIDIRSRSRGKSVGGRGGRTSLLLGGGTDGRRKRDADKMSDSDSSSRDSFCKKPTPTSSPFRFAVIMTAGGVSPSVLRRDIGCPKQTEPGGGETQKFPRSLFVFAHMRGAAAAGGGRASEEEEEDSWKFCAQSARPKNGKFVAFSLLPKSRSTWDTFWRGSYHCKTSNAVTKAMAAATMATAHNLGLWEQNFG